VTATRTEMDRAARWREQAPWFSFLVEGTPVRDLLPRWKETAPAQRAGDGFTEHTRSWIDPASGLQVRWVVKVFVDFPAVEATLFLRAAASGRAPLVESVQPMDCEMSLPATSCTLRYSRGARTSRQDFEPLERVLGTPASTIRLATGGGRSSNDYLPFFTMDAGGEGVVAGIGWTGEWAATFTRSEHGLRFQAGMALTRFRLEPGEEVRSPLVLLLFWNGTPERGQNLLRRFILRHHAPRRDGAPLSVPVLCPTWGGTPAAVHAASIRRVIEHRLPVDCWWIDAEWFGAPPWWKNTGTWSLNRDAYPQGMRPVADALRPAGMKLMVWFEIHRVSPGSAWAREHPEYLLRIGPEDARWSWPHWVDMDDPRWQEDEGLRTQFSEGDALIDLGNPDARRLVTETVLSVIAEQGIDWYREDFNIAPLAYWRHADSPERQGITEIRWIEGLYAFWDELAARHPGLIIDNCASGGRRIDLESLGRATPFWRSDFPADAETRQSHALGIMRWVPLSTMGRVLLGRDDPYEVRSSWGSSLLAFFDEGGDGPRDAPIPDSFPWDTARAQLEAFREIQPYYYGDFYPLTAHSTAHDAWAAYQLDRPEQGDGVVVAYRRAASPFATARFPLPSLDAGAVYEVTDVDRGAVTTVPASVLREEGITVRMDRAPQSAVLRYRRR
jgi:alpha-galactosidase